MPDDKSDVRQRAESYLSSCKEYSDSYEHEKLVRDWEKKGEVAKNVVGDFTRRAGDPRGKKVLDIGFGNGEYAIAFSRAGAEVTGVEVNPVLGSLAKDRANASGVHPELIVYDGSSLPFGDNSFDHAYSISVLEHTSDPRRVLEEVCRVLKPGGTFYLAFPNRIALRETHTGIYGPNYLPRSAARFVLKHVWGRDSIDELNLHFIGYLKLTRFLKRTSFRVRLEYGGSGLRGMLKRLLGLFGMHHSSILTSVMVVLEKE